MKNNERAFPLISPDGMGVNQGMDKRFYAACAALTGLLSNKEISRFGNHDGDKFDVIQQSYKFADELLKQE